MLAVYLLQGLHILGLALHTISSVAYHQCHWVRKSKINVAGPDILLHHKLINYEINMQSVDMTLGLGELAVQCNDLSALYYDLYVYTNANSGRQY